MVRMLRPFRSLCVATTLVIAAVASCSSGSGSGDDDDHDHAGGSGGGDAAGGKGGGGVGSGGSATGGSGGAANGGSGGSANGGSGGSANGGSGGAANGGSGGSANGGSGGSANGGSGGSANGGSGGMANGGAGGAAGASGKVAVAMLMSTGQTGLTMISGKATFTQTGNQVKVVIDLENCPQGARATHIHQNKACGDGGNAAGNHWANGEGMGNVQCGADMKAHFEFTRDTTKWTIGPPSATDITQHALMIHRNGEPSPGDRIACGVIDAQ